MNSFQRLSNSSFSNLPSCDEINNIVVEEKKVIPISTEEIPQKKEESNCSLKDFYLGRGPFPRWRTNFMTDSDFSLVILPNTPYHIVANHVKEETEIHERKRQMNIGYSWSALYYAPFNNLKSLKAVRKVVVKMGEKNYCMCGTRNTQENKKKVRMFHKGVVQSLSDKIVIISKNWRRE